MTEPLITGPFHLQANKGAKKYITPKTKKENDIVTD